MKVGRKKPVSGGSPGVGRRLTPGKGREVVRGPAPLEGGRHISDDMNILGIPEAELTPHVQEAIVGLMGEVDQLRGDLASMQDRLQKMEALADRDPLVPVLNRRAFIRELSRMISAAKRYGETSSLIYFDLDHFKRINDQFGHGGGDAALTHFGELLLKNVRETDVVGRLGGDEFAVILSHSTETAALEKADMLRRILALEPLDYEGQKIALSASVGATSFRNDEEAVTALARADEAMYAAKQAIRPA